MTDTEKAALCARIDELCAEVEKYRSARDASADLAAKTIDRIRELEAEAEQLRAANAAFTGRSIRAGDKMACLETENAKLQKVCKRMHDHIKECCEWCDEWCCSSWDEVNECCIFDSYMHELGIEVDA